MKISYMLRIGDGPFEPFIPEEHPDIVRKLNHQGLTTLGYVPVAQPEEENIPVGAATPAGTGSA